ncbi:MAG: hypothetical protein JNL81_15500 [Hyphomonadaceae bacterium]|nr:hypothetical protein [Hyphomonadaceae bacterium]
MIQLMRNVLSVLAASTVLAVASAHAQAQGADQTGDAYDITVQIVSESRGEGSSGSSRTSYALVERVVAVRDGGLELEFDLPGDTPPEDRARNWQFPARVFKPVGEPFQLLNAPELQARVGTWLTNAQIPEEACGRWVFTWTAIKIECDPQSVLGTLEIFDLRPTDTSASVEEIDPVAVRRERAEADVTIAQMTGGAVITLETAIEARESEQYLGTISSSYEADAAGRVTRRTVVSELQITEANGAVERRTTTTTIERRRMAP